MQITASAISLNVEDPAESATFAKQHLGFIEDMAYDGFVSLSKQDAGFNLIYLRTGLESFKPDSMRGRHADGLLVVFVVENIDEEYTRLSRGESGTFRSRTQTELSSNSSNGWWTTLKNLERLLESRLTWPSIHSIA